MQFGVFSLFDFFPDRQHEVSYYRDTLDLMIYAEKLGFDSAWAGEEHFYSFGICPSPQLFLTALARETSRIRLGTAISIMALENPLRKAEDFAMLDILSNGRLDFGAGKGGYPKHFEGFRIPFEENRARYEEALEIIQHAWTHESFSYDGTFWHIPELSLSPRPMQQPCPPIYRGMASPEAFEIGGERPSGFIRAVAHSRPQARGREIPSSSPGAWLWHRCKRVCLFHVCPCQRRPGVGRRTGGNPKLY